MRIRVFTPDIYINPVLSNFFNKHEQIIKSLLTIVQKIKKNIHDTYKFSEKYPKRTPCSKYTEKLFIGCMLYIIMNNRSWTLFIGPINGKQVHKKFRDYCNNQLFKSLFTDTSRSEEHTSELQSHSDLVC